MSTGKKWRARDAAKQRRNAAAEALRAARNGPSPKNWKLMYTRSNKMVRAKQLGFDYPRKNERQILAEGVADDIDDQDS